MAAGLLAVGTGLGARFGGFPRGLGGGILDEDLVVPADEVVVVVEVAESEAEERAVGECGGGRQMLDPVSNEDEGAGSGTECVCALCLVNFVRAGAGARVRGGVVGLSWLSG